MFAPTASPVVQRQSTWHIGPTTCVFTSRSARFDSEDRPAPRATPAAPAARPPASARARVRLPPTCRRSNLPGDRSCRARASGSRRLAACARRGRATPRARLPCAPADVHVFGLATVFDDRRPARAARSDRARSAPARSPTPESRRHPSAPRSRSPRARARPRAPRRLRSAHERRPAARVSSRRRSSAASAGVPRLMKRGKLDVADVDAERLREPHSFFAGLRAASRRRASASSRR